MPVTNTVVVEGGGAHGVSRPSGTDPRGANGAAAHIPPSSLERN